MSHSSNVTQIRVSPLTSAWSSDIEKYMFPASFIPDELNMCSDESPLTNLGYDNLGISYQEIFDLPQGTPQGTDLGPGFNEHEPPYLSQDMDGVEKHTSFLSSASSAQQPCHSGCGHYYRSLPTELRSTDKWLRPCKVNGKRGYECLWEGCAKEPFERRLRARTHVLMHLQVKLFECTCGQQFSSRAAVKRHCDAQIPSFSCDVCHRYFTRKYNRNLHQKQCASHARH
ncbi:hypothetical protein JB92DRAFT_3020214 [Gautieria morchelliformis]|nr:hypothetical protein JB92DRAFT_3020214 [Gautieria morchelliformis]